MVAVAILGFIGIIGPTSESSIFGGAWYFDNAENWAHLVLGVAGLVAAYVLPSMYQKWLVLLLGVVGVVVGLYSLFSPITAGNNLLGAQLQNPLDTILHLAVGGWALWASMRKEGSPMATPSGPAM